MPEGAPRRSPRRFAVGTEPVSQALYKVRRSLALRSSTRSAVALRTHDAPPQSPLAHHSKHRTIMTTAVASPPVTAPSPAEQSGSARPYHPIAPSTSGPSPSHGVGQSKSSSSKHVENGSPASGANGAAAQQHGRSDERLSPLSYVFGRSHLRLSFLFLFVFARDFHFFVFHLVCFFPLVPWIRWLQQPSDIGLDLFHNFFIPVKDVSEQRI